MSLLKLSLLCLALSSLASSEDSGITVAKTEFLGNVTSNSQVIRDLGFHGSVGGYNVNSYGDTFYCSQLDDSNRSGCTLPLAANTLAYSTEDPTLVNDFNLHGKQQVPYQFCPYVPAWGEVNAGEWGLGISNVVPTGDNIGILFFARNFRPPGVTDILGAGVAVVNASGPYPTCTRLNMQWWDGSKEPIYGDHGAVDGRDGYVYAFGQFGAAMQLFLLRAPLSDAATDLDSYEYWNGKEFTKDRLYSPTADQAVLFDTTQGSIFWSPYFNKWVSLTRSRWDMIGMTMRTSEKLQGPWSNETTIFRAPKIFESNMAYAPTIHPNYDGSGKTLVISYTQTFNIQQAARIHFA